MPTQHRLGSLDLAVLSDGDYYYDAGAVFGIVPRVLWESHAGPLDAQHRMTLGLNCLLLRSQGRLILIETGIGDKGAARRVTSPLEAGNLMSDLAALGVQPEEIDVVVNTHLHSDHCGWNTRYAGEAIMPTFANAEYVVMREEWEAVMAPNERTRATYLNENLAPVEAAGRLRLADGETRITNEVTLLPTPGHTAGHASVVISSGGETAIYVGDMFQTQVQLERTAWVSSFDVLPLVSMETKKALYERAVREQSLLIGAHLPYPGLGQLTMTPQGQRRWTPIEAQE